MSTNETSPVLAPWGYQYLGTQEYVDSYFTEQLVLCIGLGGYVWDAITSLSADFEFIFRRRFNYVTVVFIFNRLVMTISYGAYFAFLVTRSHHCMSMDTFAQTTESFSILSTEALLLLRILALFKNNLPLLIFMSLLMLSGPIVDMALSYLTVIGSFPGFTGCYYAANLSPYSYLPYLLQAIFDLLAFLLCSAKLLINCKMSFEEMRRPNGIMKVTREMLKGGFIYYIPVVVIQAVTVGFTSHNIYVTASLANSISSAQALRITRNLWKAGQESNSPRGSDVPAEMDFLSPSTTDAKSPIQISQRPLEAGIQN